MNKGNREINVSGIRKPEREGVQGSDGDDGGEVDVSGHCHGLDDLEDSDEDEGESGAEGHVDHGERNWEGPAVHLLVEDVLVVDNDGEAEEDPYGDVGVGEEDLLDDAFAERATFAHFLEMEVGLWLRKGWRITEEEEEEEEVR